ncbi:MAG TPA: radical SAM protein [Chitinophagales bacterium]|nr:radical SAM protein [Chitinophagales bacterium]
MKVVLAIAPVWDSVTPNLALAFLKGSLQHAGYDCKCIDFSIQFRPIMVSALGDEGAEEYIASHPKLYKSWAKQICDENPDVVGFSILGSNIKNTALVAKEVRNLLPNVMIVSGGPSLTRENKDCLEQALEFSNYLIEGEGEVALVEFVKCYESNGDFTKLKQVWFSDASGKAVYTGHTNLQNIDTIPYPDFTDFNRKLYPSPHKLPLLFSRGCILNCNYCENKWNHLTQRSRTGRNVFEELKHNVNKYNIKEYMFNDDSLISSKTLRQLDEYCDLVMAEGLVMPWSVYGTRVERLITQPFLHKLRLSGMERVSLGVESFSSRVQKEMGKSSRYDDADKMCRMFANEGIKTESWIIYGYPTETDADFDETLQWFVKNPNVLSHVTANSFGPNAKYLHDRPGIVKTLSPILGHWEGLESTLEKRKQRFLALIEVLEAIRVARKGEFSFYFGDPLYVKYFSSWTKKDKQLLLESWEKIEDPIGYQNRRKGFGKWLRILGIKQDESNLAEHVSRVPVYEKPKLEIGETNDMRQKVFARIWQQLETQKDMAAGDKELKFEQYKTTINSLKVHLNDNVSEDVMLAMSLVSPIEEILKNLDMHAPEYIAQQVVEAASNFDIPSMVNTN